MLQKQHLFFGKHGDVSDKLKICFMNSRYKVNIKIEFFLFGTKKRQNWKTKKESKFFLLLLSLLNVLFNIDAEVFFFASEVYLFLEIAVYLKLIFLFFSA